MSRELKAFVLSIGSIIGWFLALYILKLLTGDLSMNTLIGTGVCVIILNIYSAALIKER